jgi:hypothetical protein
VTRIRLLLVAVVLAIGIAVVGAYLVVISQNPASSVSPGAVYGSVSP